MYPSRSSEASFHLEAENLRLSAKTKVEYGGFDNLVTVDATFISGAIYNYGNPLIE